MAKYSLALLGGGLGSLLRFIVGMFVSKVFTGLFPLGTFLINVTGSFFIGLLMTFFLNRPELDVNWRVFFVTGILGGYTTFSSFEWEAFTALREGAGLISISYLVLSVLSGLVAVWLGAAAASALRRL